MTKKYYRVAGLDFGVELQDSADFEDRLGAYQPFEISESESLLFMLPMLKEDVDNCSYNEKWHLLINEEMMDFDVRLYVDNESIYHYITRIKNNPDNWSCLDFTSNMMPLAYRQRGRARFKQIALNSTLKLLFALCTATKDTILFHSSVIKNGGKGYMFLGKSGTGKSTHAQLWLEHISGSELLNDDNPVVRFIDGTPWVFGTPWSGKTPCYKNEAVPVGGIVRLWQAPVNEIKRLDTLQAYAALLPTILNMKWERQLADGMNASIYKLITSVPIFSLRNRPEKAAAMMSFRALKQDEGRSEQTFGA